MDQQTATVKGTNSMEINTHTSQGYSNELATLKGKLILMGRLVETQVAYALHALMTQNHKHAAEVLVLDQKVNALEVSLDSLCVDVIACRQPVASDLRFLIVAIKIVTDLERIGDEAGKMARHVVGLSRKSGKGTFEGELDTEFRQLGEQVQTMLGDALDAFERLDVEQAKVVSLSDLAVDQEFERLSRCLFLHMTEDSRNIRHGFNTMRHARSLERIGDHAKNLCEYVIYLVEGRDVRHTKFGVKV